MAGLASLPLVGKMATSMKSPMVREGIANVAGVVEDAPIYFWKLVDKIKNLGKDVTETASTLDTQKVKQYKDYELTEDLTTGQIEIQRTGRQSDDAYVNEQASEDVFMTYRPSEKILLDEANPAGGVRKTMPEYEEFTAYVSNNRGNTGEILEEVSGVPDDIFLEVGEQVPEFLRKGKAEGGIINLAGGGRVNLAKGGIPRALQAALKALKSKYGDDIIKSGDELESQSKTFDDFQTRNPDPNRPMTADELEDFEMELGGDNLEAYSFDGTVGDGARILKEQENYMEYMYDQYRTGKLDPVAGDKSPARKKLLQKRFEDMEASGDSRLMTREEIEELSTFDLGTEMDEAAKKASKIDDDIDISQGMIDLDEMNFTKNAEAAQIKLKYPGISDDLINKILIDDNPQRKAEVLATLDESFKMMDKGMGPDDIIQTFKNTSRTKQAEGGRIGLLAGGGVLKKLIMNLAKEKGMSGSEVLKVMNYKSLPSKIKNLMTKEEFATMKANRLEGVEIWKDLMYSQQEMTKNIDAGKNTPAAELFEMLEKTSPGYGTVPRNISDADMLQMEQMIKNMKTKDNRQLNATGGLANLLGE